MVREEKYDRVQKAKYAIIQSRLNTLNKGQVNVKIYMDYGVNLQLGARVKFKVDVE